ncbi:SLC16A13 [Branchiostoma lanceolatum]|uniref:SLC16A13 protein n=1 Tax=Branchiostoma lanceolatum TaxID=7740 RepID=A0A8J9Z5T9_BRALA|nr:SLC16A13 [Branchiostoma lanceolatum]
MATVRHHDEAPDGGWGWFVVLSSFLSHTAIWGTLKSFGVFFTYILHAFGEDAESTAWISSIQGALTMFGSLLTGALCNVFGCRAVVMAGSLMATVGLLSSMFVTSLPVMYLTAGLITVVGIGDLVSRIAYGWLSDLGLFYRLRGYVVCNLGLGLCLLFLPFAQTYPAMLVCCLAIGLFGGSCASQTAVFLAEFCGVSRLASAVGIAYGIQGFAMLFGPPIAGRLYDVTGNYTASFYVAGSVEMLSVLMLTSLEVHRTRTTQQTPDVMESFLSTENIEILDTEKDKEWTESIDQSIVHESSV